MGIRQFLFACVLGVGGIGAASAMDADTQELGGLQRFGVDSTVASHDVSGNGGDALGVPRDGGNQPAPASGSSSENCPTGGSGSSSTQRGRRISLGWQSLLPGSIQ